MNNETNATIDAIMNLAEHYADCDTRAAHEFADDDDYRERGEARADLRETIAAALESQARQIEALTAERDELRKRLNDAKPATPAPGEWIAWAGGSRPPITDGVQHQARLRSGGELQANCRASAVAWDHQGSSRDIVAYRILP